MRIGKIFLAICALVGVALLALSGWWFDQRLDLVTRGLSAEGTVVRLEQEYSRDSDGGGRYVYHPIVRFSTGRGEEIEFRSRSGSSTPGYRRGERVAVVYDPETPEIAEIDNPFALWGGPAIAAFIGLCFVGAPASLVIAGIRRRRLEDWLARHGQRVNADLTEVFRDTTYREWGRVPRRITAQGLDPLTRKLHVFRSRRLWLDPRPYLKGETVAVLVDPDNPRRYAFDLSFLPELAE